MCYRLVPMSGPLHHMHYSAKNRSKRLADHIYWSFTYWRNEYASLSLRTLKLIINSIKIFATLNLYLPLHRLASTQNYSFFHEMLNIISSEYSLKSSYIVIRLSDKSFSQSASFTISMYPPSLYPDLTNVNQISLFAPFFAAESCKSVINLHSIFSKNVYYIISLQTPISSYIYFRHSNCDLIKYETWISLLRLCYYFILSCQASPNVFFSCGNPLLYSLSINFTVFTI